MQTNFSDIQLADPNISEANEILRKCVHCGFCTATCPTYILMGDELDSPRGRIYLIKDLLETNKTPTKKVVTHIDRCLSCLSCMTTCPASVNYMHLVDQARTYIEKSYKRKFGERFLRKLIALIIPYPSRFRISISLARLVKPFSFIIPKILHPLLLAIPDHKLKSPFAKQLQVNPISSQRKKRIALLAGCAQQVLKPEINEASIRLLNRHGCEVVIANGAGCCGALVHHLGNEDEAKKAAMKNITAWENVNSNEALDAIVVNTSGCGTTLKNYAHLFRDEPLWAERAAKISAITCDITEIINEIGLTNIKNFKKPDIVYHSACSMQHGQQLHNQPKRLLESAEFKVLEPKEAHICCGSAGSYSLLQPKIASKLQSRKVGNLLATGAEVIATGNIGCITHLDQGMKKSTLPIVHTVELLDWATGGPKPADLQNSTAV